MTLSSFSLILGAACYIFGLPIVFADAGFLAWRKRITADEHTLRVVGVVLVAIAVTTLRYHWAFSPDAEGFIVVLVWITLAKGLLCAWWPRRAGAIATSLEPYLLSSAHLVTFLGCLMVLAGALLTYLGLVLA